VKHTGKVSGRFLDLLSADLFLLLLYLSVHRLIGFSIDIINTYIYFFFSKQVNLHSKELTM